LYGVVRHFDARSLWRNSLRFVILTGAKDLPSGRVSIGLETGHIVSVIRALAQILPRRIGSANQSNFSLAR
jgi:hypothetical protein